MRIPDYNALRTAVENEESILWLIGETMCLPDYDALRAAVENEESISGLLNAAVQNSGTQFEEIRVRWVTINGRHIPMRDKDAGGGGGSSADNGLTSSGSSGIINNKINTTYNSSNVNLTYHAIEQAISRNVSIDDMIDAIDNGLLDRSIKIDCNGRRSFQRIGRRATVAIDPDNNNVTSAWPTSTKRRNRLLKALQEGQYEESEIHARTNQVTSKFRPPNSH